MAAQIPESCSVRRTVAALKSDEPPTDAQLSDLLDSPGLKTGLDRWQLWTLVCLCRHLNRQKWVGYVVETRLKGDLVKLGAAGSLGHPDGIPQEGEVPDEPGWRYYFHGGGCCLTHEGDGTNIDVDFTDEGASDRIDRFFFSRFLEDLKRPEFPEQMLQRKEPFQHAWQADIDALALEGCIETKQGIRITSLGKDLTDSLEPVLAVVTDLSEADSMAACRRLAYAALSLGDLLLSQQLAVEAGMGEAIVADIARAAEQARQRRAALLTESLRTTSSGADSCQLAALADLGTRYAKPVVTDCVFRTPVDGLANTALAVLVNWNEPDLLRSLEQLLELRYRQSFGIRSIARAFLSGQAGNDQQPREYQLVHAVIALLQRSAPAALNPPLRGKVLSLLEASGGANSGEAALLLYAFDHEGGLNRLRAALSGKIPATHSDAAAACVLLGTSQAKEILVEGLKNPNLQIQHTAACALKRFPATDAREVAARWCARLDGIDSPEGKEVSIAGKTITAYTFDDVSHANMDMFFSTSLDRLRKDFGLILAQAS